MSQLKVLFFGGYKADYPRNQIAIHAMEKAGITVEQLHDSHGFLWRFLPLLAGAVKKDFDALWVGYSGHADVLIAKIICLLKGKPLVFDMFVSHYDSEREYNPQGVGLFGSRTGDGEFRLALTRFLDKLSCMLPDKVLADTEQHAEFLSCEFGVPKQKFSWFFAGANEKIMVPPKYPQKKGAFTVLFYGWVTPLHGFKYIVEAARLVEKMGGGINFVFIGDSRYFREFRDSPQKPGNAVFLPPVSHPELAAEISKATVCLGIFGTSGKASRVIPNKVFEPLAMGKPLITASTPAVLPYLVHKRNALLVSQGSAREIADAIIALKKDPKLLARISKGGRDLYSETFSEEKIGQKIKSVLEAVARRK